MVGAGPVDCIQCGQRLPLCHKVEAGAGFMVTSRPGMRPMGVPSKGSGALQDTAPRLFLPKAVPLGPPASLLTSNQERWQAHKGEGWINSYLTLHLRTPFH